MNKAQRWLDEKAADYPFGPVETPIKTVDPRHYGAGMCSAVLRDGVRTWRFKTEKGMARFIYNNEEHILVSFSAAAVSPD